MFSEEIKNNVEKKIKKYKGGRSLPSDLRKRIWAAIDYFEEHGSLTIEEPCNCGSRIRHNNGGNYHKIISLTKDEDKNYVQYETTCELIAPAEWEECDDPIGVIIDNGDFL